MKRLLTILAIIAATATAQSGAAKPWSLWGQVWASAFSQWSVQSLTPIPSAGTYTLKLSTAAPPVLPGGQQFQPFATNAPLVVDPGPNQEAATPSAVSCSFGQGFCTITVTLVKAHNYIYNVQSGTAGLQEAINFIAAPGGAVQLDPGWTGTTSMITGAAGSAAVEILDQRSGQTTWYGWSGSAYVSAFSINNPPPGLSGLTCTGCTFAGTTSVTGPLNATGGGALSGGFALSSGTLSGTTTNTGTIAGGAVNPQTHWGVLQVADYCTTPSAPDQTCWNNAVAALPGGGSVWADGVGTLDPGNVTYTLSAPIVLHRFITVLPSHALIVSNGTADFSATGMVRFCANADCTGSPTTPIGERDVTWYSPHIRVGKTADIAFNGYGLTDSYIYGLFVDSIAGTFGQGTCMTLNADTGVSAYRNTFVNVTCYLTKIGVLAGNTGTAGEIAADNFVGGSVWGSPAVHIANGASDSFYGMTFNGLNTNGDTLVLLDAGSYQTHLDGDYFDQCVGGVSPCSGTSTFISENASANFDTFRNLHADAEGGSYTVSINSTNYTASGNNDMGIPTATGEDSASVYWGQVPNGGGGAGTKLYWWGQPTSSCSTLSYAFCSSSSNDGLDFASAASASTTNTGSFLVHLRNSASTNKLFGGMVVTSVGDTSGEEDGKVEFDEMVNGTVANVYNCIAGGGISTCNVRDSLTINGGSALTTTNQSGTGSLVMTSAPSLDSPTFTTAFTGPSSFTLGGHALTAPSSAGQLALVSQIPTGTLSGSLTATKIPVATGASTIADGSLTDAGAGAITDTGASATQDIFNNAVANSANVATERFYLNNASGTKTLFGGLFETSATTTAGSETGDIEFLNISAGSLNDALKCVGFACNFPGTLTQGMQPVVLAGANGLSAGTIALSTGAGSHTFTAAYSAAPVCVAADTTAANAVQVTSSATAVTVAGTGSDVIAWRCSPAVN